METLIRIPKTLIVCLGVLAYILYQTLLIPIRLVVFAWRKE